MKMNRNAMVVSTIGLVWLSACGPTPGNPVVFGQTQTLGVSVGQSAGTPAPEFTLGYSDANIAILPTETEVAAGTKQKLGASDPRASNGPHDTFTVFGQFGTRGDRTTSGDGSFALEKFFATGAAAQNLSQGFACAASSGRSSPHCHQTTTHTQPSAPAPATGTGGT